MNIYVIVEGERATKKIYRKWVTLVNRNLNPVDDLGTMAGNSFFLLAGHGQPNFWTYVDRAVEDANSITSIERLVVCVDSEDESYEARLTQAKERVERIGCRVEVKYVIQHFCLEAWLLGNSSLFPNKTHDHELRGHYSKFDVRKSDPELLPPHLENDWNRATFAYHFLRAGIRCVHGNRAHYSKSNPGIALDEGFFNKVRERCTKVGHLQSFRSFLQAFV